MCGGFPLYLAKSECGWPAVRQVLFIAGKSFTYIFLGAAASALGVVLFRDTAFARAAVALRLAVGFLTIFLGLLMVGVRLPRLALISGAAEAGLVRSLFGPLMAHPGAVASFILGIGVGFLPCPLPMGMLAAAAASHNVPSGILLMGGVGLGTAPGLLVAGLFGTGLSRRFTWVGLRAAGVVVILLGLLTVGRATGIVQPQSAVSRVVPSCCSGHAR